MNAAGWIERFKTRFSDISDIKEIFGKTKVNPAYLGFTAFLSFITASLEGISIGLLVPLVKGVIEMDFGFLKDFPVFSKVMVMFPGVFSSPNLPTFILLLALIFTAALSKSILQYARALIVSSQMAKSSHNLRKYIFKRYMRFGKLFFERNNTGHLQYLLTSVTKNLSDIVRLFGNFFDCLFSFIVYMALMLVISAKLTLIVVLLFPLINYLLRFVILKLRASSRFRSECNKKLNEKAFNVLSCIPLIKAYSNEEKEKESFSKISQESARWDYSVGKKTNLIAPMQEIVTLFAISLLVLAMSYMVLKVGNMQIAGFIVYFYLIKRVTFSFNMFNNVRGSFAKINGPIAQIKHVISNEDKFFVAGGEKEFRGLKEKIELKNMGFSYLEKVPILKGVSMVIEKGKMTAIVGPTGSGKTTIIGLLLRFYECPPGTIRIDGEDIRNFNLGSLRQHMALVSQDTLLFNDTLRNNIIYGLNRKVSEHELEDVLKKARLFEFVNSLPEGYYTLIGDRGVKLSGGEKQRVAIARALLKGSEILILDEATSSLDTKTERFIQEAIDEAVKDRTAIVIAHRLSTIKNADKIIVIEDGKVAEEGALNGLMGKKGKFYEYWTEQKFD